MFKRINAQDGLFTRTLYNKDIQEYSKQYYTFFKNKGEGEIVFLIKILIPDGGRNDVLKTWKERI